MSAPGAVDSLGHFEAKLARNQGRLPMEAQVERLRAIAASDFE
jgi:hypothetical protein